MSDPLTLTVDRISIPECNTWLIQFQQTVHSRRISSNLSKTITVPFRRKYSFNATIQILVFHQKRSWNSHLDILRTEVREFGSNAFQTLLQCGCISVVELLSRQVTQIKLQSKTLYNYIVRLFKLCSIKHDSVIRQYTWYEH